MSATSQAPDTSHSDPITSFITKYTRESQQWHTYLNHTKTYLESAVKQAGIPSTISGRVKAASKVEYKLRKKQSFYRYTCEKHILNNMVDFIGLRVSAYFPDDQKRILKLVDEKFVTIASVVFRDDEERYILSEGVVDERGREVVAYINRRYEEAMAGVVRKKGGEGKGVDDARNEIVKYIHQRYATRSSSIGEESSNPEDFKHPKDPPSVSAFLTDDNGKELISYINQRYTKIKPPAPKQTYNPKSLDNYQRRFGGYTAEHRWVILRPEQRDPSHPLHLQPIEIQIRSVLMDSWIAINRDIEYDALTGVLSTQERRILDSIKGLAQTGELLLEQLHHVHKERIKADQVRFKTNDDVARVLAEYFELEELDVGVAKDPFAGLLFSVVGALGIDRPGTLKLQFTKDVIEPDCASEFNVLRKRFPMDISLETYVLSRLLQNIRREDAKNLYGVSVIKVAPFRLLLQRTLGWIGQLERRENEDFSFRSTSPLPLTCGYPRLTLLVCVLVWTFEEVPELAITDDSMRAMLLSTLFEWSEVEDDSAQFAAIAVTQSLLVEAHYSNVSHIEWVLLQLLSRPIEWERGVALFAHFYEKCTSEMQKMGTIDEDLVRSMERTSEQMNRSIFHRVAKILSVSEAFRIVHTTSEATSESERTLPHSHVFWKSLKEHTLLQGFDRLVDKRGKAFEPWMEYEYPYGRSSKGGEWTPARAGITYKIPVEERQELKKRLRPELLTFNMLSIKDHDYSKREVTLFMLNCEGLSHDAVSDKIDNACKLGSGSGADVVFLKNFDDKDMLHAPYLEAYYLGRIELDDPPGLHLVTLVEKKRIAPTRASEEAGFLGPLWKVVSSEQNAYALVCDILINVGPGLPPARLRLPNCKPGTEIGPELLPSESDWTIEECEFDQEGGKTGTVVKNGLFQPPSVLYNGDRNNIATFGDNHYMLAFTLRRNLEVE